MRFQSFRAGALASTLALAQAAALIAGLSFPARAGDLPGAKEPPAASGNPWSGFYFGGHVGGALGLSGWTAAPAAPASGTTLMVAHDGQLGPMAGGFQGGWNHLVDQHWLLGAELDASFPNTMLGSHEGFGGALTQDAMQYFASLRGRFGYAFDNWLVYAVGGPAVSREMLTRNGLIAFDQNFLTRWGYVAGAGVELRLSPQWSARLEYVYSGFANSNLYFANAGQNYSSNLGVNLFSIGLNYHFSPDENTPGFFSNMDNWSIHGQTTTIWQGSAPFSALYSGAQSLGPAFNGRDTVSGTAFIGYRIQPGTEIYFNPEPFQGFGLATTRGLAGFSNGEAQKAGFLYPHYNSSRLFVRQYFGLGGEQEDIDDGPNQFGGKQDISRVTVTAGRLSIPDIFDNNSYSHDPRGQFMNWALMDAGAFDYAADQKGYTWGLAAELNQKSWTARLGYFLEPAMPNGNVFNTSFGKGQTIGELETRYTIFERQGKLRLDAWWADGVSGSFDEALDNPAIGVANIQQTWRHRPEYGFIVNAEQSITDDLGLFSRLSWRSPGTQIMAWTDIDESASLGASLKGTAWGRAQDTVGLAGVLNGLAPSYRNFLAAGGMGINIGDGALNYSGEKIIETYYQIGLNKWSALTFDYQFIGSPAYNSVRGPANIISARYHAQF